MDTTQTDSTAHGRCISTLEFGARIPFITVVFLLGGIALLCGHKKRGLQKIDGGIQ